MLYDFISKEIKDKAIVEKLLISHKKYPLYKDLEPTKIYDFNVTAEINNTIHGAIQVLKEYLSARKEELTKEKKSTEMGINIHSIIHEHLYNNIILEERIHMFENYLNTFISHHSKYFGRLTIKSKLMLGIVNEDFHLNKSKSLAGKTLMKRPLTPAVDDAASVSSTSSTVSSPKSSMNGDEEMNVRLLVGDTEASKEIQAELNTILQHIPQNEDELNTRRTVNLIADI